MPSSATVGGTSVTKLADESHRQLGDVKDADILLAIHARHRVCFPEDWATPADAWARPDSTYFIFAQTTVGVMGPLADGMGVTTVKVIALSLMLSILRTCLPPSQAG